MCSNPAAARVFRNCGQKIVFELVFMLLQRVQAHYRYVASTMQLWRFPVRGHAGAWAALLHIPPRGWARLAIWRLVLALDLAPGTRRLNFRPTLRARVRVSAGYRTILDAKLFATMH